MNLIQFSPFDIILMNKLIIAINFAFSNIKVWNKMNIFKVVTEDLHTTHFSILDEGMTLCLS